MPSTRSWVPFATRRPSTTAPARSTAAASGRPRAGQTLQATSFAGGGVSSAAFVIAPGADVEGASGRARRSRAGSRLLRVLPREDELPRGSRLVEAPHRRLRRSVVELLGGLDRLAVDREERVGE